MFGIAVNQSNLLEAQQLRQVRNKKILLLCQAKQSVNHDEPQTHVTSFSGHKQEYE